MKKIYRFAFAVVATALTLSCSKGDNDAPVKMKTISVELGASQIQNTYAPSAAPESKTTLVNGSQVYWTGADKNILCITTDGSFYTLSTTESTQAATKTFTGEIPAEKEPLFYYYDRNRTSSNKQVTYNAGNILRQLLDNSQACPNGGGFHQGMNYAIAKPGDSAFKNALSYIKWTNNGNAISSVKFETLTSGEYLTGYFNINYNGNEPITTKYVYSGASTAACSPYVISSITNTPPSGKSYYAIVVPGTYHGLKVTITLTDNTSFTLGTQETIILERGKYLDFGVLPTAPVTTYTGSFTLSTGQDFEEGWSMAF